VAAALGAATATEDAAAWKLEALMGPFGCW